MHNSQTPEWFCCLLYLTAGHYPHLFLGNKAVYGLPFQPHVDFTPVC